MFFLEQIQDLYIFFSEYSWHIRFWPRRGGGCPGRLRKKIYPRWFLKSRGSLAIGIRNNKRRGFLVSNSNMYNLLARPSMSFWGWNFQGSNFFLAAWGPNQPTGPQSRIMIPTPPCIQRSKNWYINKAHKEEIAKLWRELEKVKKYYEALWLSAKFKRRKFRRFWSQEEEGEGLCSHQHVTI